MSDTTKDLISDILAEDVTLNPSTTVVQGDGMYTIRKQQYAQSYGFDTSSIPTNDVITGVFLHVRYGTEAGYVGTEYIQWKKDSDP